MTAQERQLPPANKNVEPTEGDARDLLIGNSSRRVILGIVALAAYWA